MQPPTRLDTLSFSAAPAFGGFTPDFPHLLSGKEFKNENLYRL
jgi:hypothetical protein